MHKKKLEDLLKALLKNGLKIPPRKCQLFKTELQYMGNTIFIQGKKRVCKAITQLVTGNTKVRTSKNSKRLQKFCRNGKFS